MHGINVGKVFLGELIWAAIPFKQYQNRSGCGTDHKKVRDNKALIKP